MPNDFSLSTPQNAAKQQYSYSKAVKHDELGIYKILLKFRH